MKILILANDDEGLYQFRKELLIELLKTNSVYATVPDGPYKEDLISLGVELKTIKVNRHGVNPVEDIKLAIKYARLIKEKKPDIVLTYTIKPNVYGGIVCQLFRIPYIVNITGLGTAVENEGLMQTITLFLYRIGLQKATMVFFQNSENEHFMLEHKVVHGSHELLPGSGVNLNYFEPMEYPGDDVVHFAFISRIMKEKGIEQYLGAARVIHKKYPNTVFHVCGYCEQNYSRELEKLQDEGTIIYHGCIRDVREMHKISHCTIHPTFYPEGLSNVLLESLSCCRPIITTDRSGCREVVEDGVNGFIVKQQDTDDLVRKIELFLSLANSERRTMGLNGREKVLKEFDRTIVVEKYLSTIRGAR